MQKEVLTFKSQNGNDTITYYRYLPESADKPKAVLQIIHGMAEYIERYEPFIEEMVKQNILVCGADHLGHGSTAANECDYGYMGEKDGNLVLAADAYALFKIMKQDYADVPYFCFGHSMGSFVLRDMLARFSPELAGAIICGTGGPNQPFAAGKLCIKTVRLFKGSRYRSAFVNNLMFGSYNKAIASPRTAFDWLTKDEAIVDAYIADPKCGFMFTVAAMEDLITLLARISRTDWADKLSKNLPLYLIAGEQDPVGAYGKGVKIVYERIQKACVKDVSCKLYPNDRHELLNETDKEQVTADILAWMEAHIA